MNKVVLGVVAVVLIGGGFYAVAKSQADAKLEAKMMMEEKAMMEKEKMQMEEKAMMEKVTMEKEAMMKDGMAMEKKSEDTMMKAEEGAMMKKDGEAMMKDDMTMEKEETSMMKKGSYELYEASKLAMAEQGKVVLFFKASWCPSCKTLDASIKANLGSIPVGVTILEVNYDTETALKQKYGVTYQHTMVQVDKEGNQIAKWSGSPTLAELVTKIK